MDKAFLVTIPHSGEKIPEGVSWLDNLSEEILMCDVDRYVDVLYEPALKDLNIPHVKTEWHRYAGDLNRIPEDIDESSVEGSKNPKGMFNRGFHWTITTKEFILMKSPMSQDLHQKIIKLIYDPFHSSIESIYKKYVTKGFKRIYHLDAHSMPSVGLRTHRDPGERRADIVVSDCLGKSCTEFYRDLVISAYCVAGFKVAYNWPYMGGRVTEAYGKPSDLIRAQEAIQVELNRDLYMDEVTKKIKPEHIQVQKKISKALDYIIKNLPS